MAQKKKKKKVQGTSERYRIFVDYENAPDCLDLVERYEIDQVWIFVGRQQKKIPLEAVQQMQRWGRVVHWVAPGVVGKNALDFILAMHVGIHHIQADEKVAFAIFSADRGYDPLLGELEKAGRKAVRVNPERAVAPRKKRSRRAKKKVSGTSSSTSTPASSSSSSDSSTRSSRSPASDSKSSTSSGSSRSTRSSRGSEDDRVDTHLIELVNRAEDRLARMSQDRLPTRKRTLLKHLESQLPDPDKDQAESILLELRRRKVVAVNSTSGMIRFLNR